MLLRRVKIVDQFAQQNRNSAFFENVSLGLMGVIQFHIFRVMLLFRKHLLEQGEAGKEVINILNLYHELTGYQAISGAQAQKKKDIQAHQIYKSVITPVGVFIKYIF